MNEIKYSLCIAEIDFNTNEVKNKVWRVADFDAVQACFVLASYSAWDEKSIESYNPRYIRAFANTLTPYKPEIRSWNIVTGINSYTGEPFINTESNPDNEYPIEILFLPEIDLEMHNSDSAIRSILQDGIAISEHVTDPFFLVTNKSNISYEALFCRKKYFQIIPNTNLFKIQKHCTDMLRTVHNLGLHVIKKDEVLNTEHCSMFFEQGKKVPTRFFYKFLAENREDRKLFLRNPEDYAKAFISKYIKNNKEILKISKADAQKWTIMIDEAFSNKSEIENFFATTSFRFSDIDYALKVLSADIRQLYLQEDDFSRIVERSLLKDPAVLSKYKQEAKKIWVLEQNELKDAIISEIQNSQMELQAVVDMKTNLNTEIEKLSEVVLKLNNECSCLQEQERLLMGKCSGIQDKIKTELKHFQEDIVHLAALSALSNANSETSARSLEPYIMQPEVSIGTTWTNIEGVDGFVDDLQDNLITFGLSNEHSYDLALFIVSAALLHRNLVVCGSKSIEIGNSISLLMEKQSAKQIYLPIGYDNINKLIGLINELPNKVIIINNALDTISDTVFLSLSKCCQNKLLLFSCEDANTYKHFPTQWGSYVGFVYPDSIWNIPTGDELRCGDFDLLSQKIEIDIKSFVLIEEIKKIEKIKASSLNNILRILSLYERLGNKKTPFAFSTICNFLTCTCTKKEAVLEFLSRSEVSEDVIALVEGEFCYE